MAKDIKTAVVEQLATGAGSTVLTVDTGKVVTIIGAVAANQDASNVATLQVQINHGSGLATYIPTRNVPPGKTDLMPELLNQALEAGDILQAIAGSASDINFKISYEEDVV